ncbi:immunoglobulin lambda-1 light chain-like isoform X2 [Nannospalax galili]|uniref:immunoglobulin lambda-1 light chain-like isoform X2 n=1 Tax=Nannospalax galili TaxID=1026970 RepID=UPI00111C4DBC|nr:immunoglobulin lambda-1 light chain-like isoform X2 [Nannospalax galili]
MAWSCLLIVLTLFSGSLSQSVLTQPPSASSSLGKSVQLTCTLSSGFSNYAVGWYQQRPGKSPRFVFLVGPNGIIGSKGDGIPDRYTGAGSWLDRYLNIQNVQEEDEGVYYCGLNHDVFGGGTRLTVIGQPQAKPTLTLFPPSPEEQSSNKATVVCLISDFYPGAVTVAWKADGTAVNQGIETTQPSKQNNSKYMASSYLTLTANEWKSGKTYTCQVTHEGNKVEKSVSAAECS